MPLIIDLKVGPSSGRQKCLLDKSGTLKCYLKSPPEQGKANNELIKFLAKNLGLAQENVLIVNGQTSRNKRIKIIADLTFEQLLSKLGIERQQKIF
jgi:uncharacterized protein (TIGR00251 family)